MIGFVESAIKKAEQEIPVEVVTPKEICGENFKMLFDINNRQFYYIRLINGKTQKTETKIFRFEDVFGVERVKSNELVCKKSVGRVIGISFLCFLLGGLVGLIIGGIADANAFEFTSLFVSIGGFAALVGGLSVGYAISPQGDNGICIRLRNVEEPSIQIPSVVTISYPDREYSPEFCNLTNDTTNDIIDTFSAIIDSVQNPTLWNK